MQIEEGKKELIYYKEVDTGRLIQELYDAIPELKPEILDLDNRKFKINLRVFTNGNKLMLWVLENIDEESVNHVIENHIYVVEKVGEV